MDSHAKPVARKSRKSLPAQRSGQSYERNVNKTSSHIPEPQAGVENIVDQFPIAPEAACVMFPGAFGLASMGATLAHKSASKSLQTPTWFPRLAVATIKAEALRNPSEFPQSPVDTDAAVLAKA